MNPPGDPLRLLQEGARAYGVRLSEGEIGRFRLYLEELILWNRRVNLTGLSTPERMVIDLFLDSLVPAPFLPEKGTLLDVGSGVGVPGLPLKIVRPLLEIDLLEPRAKRVSFLRQVIRLLGLHGARVVRARVEEDRKGIWERHYQVVTARAVAPLCTTLSWCAPRLLPDGIMVCFLGSAAGEAIEACGAELARGQLVLHRRIPYTLPGKKEQREAVLFQKRGY